MKNGKPSPYGIVLTAFLKAESDWLDSVDFPTPEGSPRLRKIAEARAADLRAISTRLGGAFVRHTEHHLGKNFGLPKGD